jgi:hypothetical protein
MTFGAVFYTVSFIVPGFLMSAMLEAFIPPVRRETTHAWVKYLTFSCLNYGIWSGFIYWLLTSGAPQEHAVLTGIAWFAVTFVSPLVIGAILGVLRTKKPVRNMLRKIGFYVIHPTPTAWEYKLGDGRPYWVIVTCEDGSKIRGRYSGRSLASSEPDQRDIYLERIYSVSEGGDWEYMEESCGMWISSGDIRRIEFFEMQKEEPNVE